MTNLKANLKIFGVFALVLVFSTFAIAQSLDGTLRGEVTDPSGAVVSGAKVTLTNVATGQTQTTTSTSAGSYVFPNLLVGTYTLTVENAGFQTFSRKNIEVRSNQVTEATARLTVGDAGTTVEVIAGAEVVQTETSQLTNTFNAAQLTNLSTGVGGSVLNLATLAPNTTTQGGGVLGAGGSVGGTRPRQNNFTIDGLDDNDLSVTGPMSSVITDAVSEFTLITNQFSAEYGHSAGGQFNLVTKSGTNNWHGTGFWSNNNRLFNALDNIEKSAGIVGETSGACFTAGTCKPRFDFNQVGGSLGGPIVKNRVFIFGAYQFTNVGSAGSSTAITEVPTAAGLTNLNTLADNAAVRAILAQFPTVGTATRTVNVTNTATGVTLPVGIGETAFFAPEFATQHDYHVNGDINFTRHQLRMRYLSNKFKSPVVSTMAQTQFTSNALYENRKATVSDVWSINSRLVNDLRLGYTRNVSDFSIPAAFSNYPNVYIDELSNFESGPNGNLPQSGVANIYQLSDAMTFTAGKHTWKWGAEGRKWIAPSDFLPRGRGEWEYQDLQQLVNDFVPFSFAKRGAGSGLFDGNQTAFYGFLQDDFKVTPRLTLNLGVRYEWTGQPNGVATQTLNAISTLPGTIFDFKKPKSDTNNWAPRVGFAWDPLGDNKWAIRGGFAMAYDVTFGNLPLLQLPPQLQSEQDPDITCALPGRPTWCATYTGAPNTGRGFLNGGGLLQVNVPPADQAEARASTGGVILDMVQPKTTTWTLSVQREIWKNASLEARYLGTRNTNLPVQVQANAQTAFQNGAAPLPVYLTASAVPTSAAATSPTLAQFLAARARPFAAAGFVGPVTTFQSVGEGTYHSGALDFIQRATRGLYLRANYTWAKNIDNSTNELFSSLVNPRRPQDSQNINGDRGRSVLDITHKFALSFTYEFPKWQGDSGFAKAFINGWQINGTNIIQSGQPITVQSGQDANGNLDGAGDRAIFNPAGTTRTGSSTNFVCRSGTGVISTSTSAGGCGGNAFVIGYVAVNPAAMYVLARPGSVTTVGRNTETSPGLNNWDLALFKNTNITEKVNLQFRFEAFNAFNHRQFSYANGGVFGNSSAATSAFGYSRVTASNFLDPKQLNGGSRNIQLGLKLIF